ncbi:DinB family protein [Mucilaginibacter myungsuensis]|uniref:DinB family protein n=1 Tax=Mucilaginibacter myungsuensis TaxID=649104 RepID=A0A929PVN6_9SPHI|nr:DinB family protein [Mucilaginibacter myungsuensis]MBE9660292.1 DinB family protein [Mucilaginibacter myungsuensis]MDN3600334.1 DinB family protein [Mucilaginibacter myungsuensis]
MINYFSKLFDYDKAASIKLLDLMTTSGTAPYETVKIFAHMMAAQNTWLLRAKKLNAPGGPLWPDSTLEELRPSIISHHAAWKEWLNGQSDDILTSTVSYQNSAGTEFNTAITDVITQVLNHGTHHRGQIGIYLKQAGLQLPGTDHILFSRGLL